MEPANRRCDHGGVALSLLPQGAVSRERQASARRPRHVKVKRDTRPLMLRSPAPAASGASQQTARRAR